MPRIYDHEKIVQVLVRDDEKRKLRRLAAREERSISAMMRLLINQAYERVFGGETAGPAADGEA